MREYLAALLALLVGAVTLLLAYGATWAVATVPVFTGDATPGVPASDVALSGRDLAPLGSAAGWLALAGVAVLLATRAWGRRIVGAVLVLCGGAAGATALAFGLTGASFIDAVLDARAMGDVTAQTVSTTGWWIVAMGGALLVVIVGFLAVIRGPAWPGMSRRYERPAGPAPTETSVGGVAAWDALDRGEDPTDPRPRSG
ncbi:MAG: Trp biosynthesis-associated membrane protein [Candidatus Nanopelagicales bacterium]